MGDLLRVGTVGRMLGISADRVRDLIAAGRLRAERTADGMRLVRLEDVERLRDERERRRTGVR